MNVREYQTYNQSTEVWWCIYFAQIDHPHLGFLFHSGGGFEERERAERIQTIIDVSRNPSPKQQED